MRTSGGMRETHLEQGRSVTRKRDNNTYYEIQMTSLKQIYAIGNQSNPTRILTSNQLKQYLLQDLDNIIKTIIDIQ